MIERYKMTVVREERCVFGVIAADRKTENLREKPGVPVDMKNRDRIVSRI